MPGGLLRQGEARPSCCTSVFLFCNLGTPFCLTSGICCYPSSGGSEAHPRSGGRGRSTCWQGQSLAGAHPAHPDPDTTPHHPHGPTHTHRGPGSWRPLGHNPTHTGSRISVHSHAAQDTQGNRLAPQPVSLQDLSEQERGAQGRTESLASAQRG